MKNLTPVNIEISDLVKNQFSELNNNHQNLSLEATRDSYSIRGALSFKTVIGSILVEDEYEILIKFTPSYPNELPRVYEVGGKIHKVADSHVYPKTERLCLGTNTACLMKHLKSKNLLRFVNEQLIPYLAGHSIYKKYGFWPQGEYSHDAKGLFEYYGEYFKIDDSKVVILFLELALNWQEKFVVKATMCPCESGKMFGVCHYQSVRTLKKPLLKDELREDLRRYKEYAKMVEQK